MAEIDSLVIDITASSAKAQSALNGLAQGLAQMQSAIGGINTTQFSSIANGIREIATAMKEISGVDKRSFTSLRDKFNALANIDANKLGATANALQNVGASFNSLSGMAQGSIGTIKDMVVALGSLGSAKVTKATDNIRPLGNALRDLFVTLSSAPQVSDNVIQMTNALANLANNGSKVSSATQSINNGLKNTASRANASAKSFKGLASQIGMFYAKFFLVVRGIKALWNAVGSSMDYVETFNYWNVALDKVRKEYDQDWERWSEELGVSSAEEYANSFSNRLKTLTRKMTGYQVGDSGELMLSDSLGLAMDANKLMEYQAQILGITNSVGILGETSIDSAKALSMLAGDLSSLTNTNLETVMENLRSGLIGQSRALYKYGIDITSATLSTYALANGISKKVSEMSQDEKMQLRLLAILDQSKVAWADQANTINSVANQYRIFQQQVANLGRVLGNLLLPIVQKVLPYVNAVIIVLQKLFTLLGFKLFGDSWLKDLQDGISGGAIDDAIGADDLAEDFDDATNSAKKLKKQLQGFDELNVITQQESSGSGAGGYKFDLADAIKLALKDYESIWNKALENMKNNAETIANKIWSVFERLSNSKFGQAMRDLAKVLKEIGGYTFETLIDFYNEFLKPVASWVGNKVIKKMVDLFKEFVGKIKWKNVLSALKNIYKVLAKFTTKIGDGLLNVFKVLGKIGINVLAGMINSFAVVLDILARVLLLIPDEVLVAIGGALGAILATKGVTSVITKVATAFTKVSTAIKGLDLAKTVEGFVGMPIPIMAVVAVIGALVAVMVELNEQYNETIDNTINSALSYDKLAEHCSLGVLSITELNDAFTEKTNSIANSWRNMNSKIEELETSKKSVSDTKEELSELFLLLENGAVSADEKVTDIISSFQRLYDDSVSVFEQEYEIITYGIVTSMSDALQAMGYSVDGIVENLYKLETQGNESLENIRKKFEEAKSEFEKTGDAQSYIDVVKELSSTLTDFGVSGAITDAKKQLEELNGALDLQSLLVDGKVDTTKLEEFVSQISEAYNKGLTDIKTASADYKTTLDDWKATLESLGVDTSSVDWDSLYQANTDALNTATKDFEDAFGTYLSKLSAGLLEELPSVLEQAEKDYVDMNPLKRVIMSNFSDIWSGADYQSDVAQKWTNNVVNPIFDALADSIEGFNKNDSEAFKKEFAEVVNGLFDIDGVLLQANGSIIAPKKLSENWENIIKDAVKMFDPSQDMSNVGTDIIDGLVEPIEKEASGGGKSRTGKSVRDWVQTDVVDETRNTLDSHSPSRVMKDIGLDIVDGLNLGIEDNADSTLTSVGNWVSSIATAFINKTSDFINIGHDIAQGIIDGIDEMEVNVQSKAQDIAEIVKTAIGNGLNTGKPVSPVNNSSVSRQSERFGSTVNNTSQNQGVALNNSNPNVTVVLEGDAKTLFRQVKKSADDYHRTTGKPAFNY